MLGKNIMKFTIRFIINNFARTLTECTHDKDFIVGTKISERDKLK